MSTAGGAKTVTVQEIGGFPDRLRVKLAYTERVTITSTVGAIGIYRWRGNDVFDPNYTGTGAQPCNADVFTAQYLRCRVFASHINVVCGNIAGDTPGDWVVCPTNGTTNFLYEEYCSQPYSKFCQNVTYGALDAPILSVSARSEMVLGRAPMSYWGSDNTQSLTTTTPADVWYWTVAAISHNRSTTTTYPCTVSIVYEVEYFDRIPSALSAESKLALRRDAQASSARRSAGDVKDCDLGDRKQLPDDAAFVFVTPSRAMATAKTPPVIAVEGTSSRPAPARVSGLVPACAFGRS